MQNLSNLQKAKEANQKTNGKLFQIVKELQELRNAGQVDSEIEQVVHNLDLPFNLHLYLMGNYSFLMGLLIK